MKRMSGLDVPQRMGEWWAVTPMGKPIMYPVQESHRCTQITMTIRVAPVGCQKKARCTECGRTGTIQGREVKWDERIVNHEQ